MTIEMDTQALKSVGNPHKAVLDGLSYLKRYGPIDMQMGIHGWTDEVDETWYLIWVEDNTMTNEFAEKALRDGNAVLAGSLTVIGSGTDKIMLMLHGQYAGRLVITDQNVGVCSISRHRAELALSSIQMFRRYTLGDNS